MQVSGRRAVADYADGILEALVAVSNALGPRAPC